MAGLWLPGVNLVAAILGRIRHSLLLCFPLASKRAAHLIGQGRLTLYRATMKPEPKMRGNASAWPTARACDSPHVVYDVEAQTGCARGAWVSLVDAMTASQDEEPEIPLWENRFTMRTAALVACVGAALYMITSAIGGELGLRSIVISIAAAAVMFGVVFTADFMARKLYIYGMRRNLRRAAEAAEPQVPPAASTPVAPEAPLRQVARVRGVLPFVPNVRTWTVWFFVQPNLVTVPLALILGEVTLVLISGVVMGLVSAVMPTAAWLLWRDRLAERGVRW